MAAIVPFIPTIMSVVGTAVSVIGQMNAAKASEQQGLAIAMMRQSEAAELERQAGEQKAESQRVAQEERRRSRLVASRAVALTAGQGGGVEDPTIQRLLADIQGEGGYRAAVRLYEGEEAARQLQFGASSRRASGMAAYDEAQNTGTAMRIGALGSLISGAGSMYEKYDIAKNKPKASASSGSYLPLVYNDDEVFGSGYR